MVESRLFANCGTLLRLEKKNKLTFIYLACESCFVVSCPSETKSCAQLTSLE